MARKAAGEVITTRGPFDGVAQIIRFNWPYYLIAGLLIAAGTLLLMWWVELRSIAGTAIILASGAAAFWSLISILVSFYVYDRSLLYKWEWLAQMLNPAPQTWVNFNAGLDESTGAIRLLFPQSEGTCIDIYDQNKMKEHSIKRARSGTHESDANEIGDSGALPHEDSTCDAAFLIFVAHELRGREDRVRFFKEIRRVLKPGGRLILVEHLRDRWNFLAYGPGVRHFFPRAEWRRIAKTAGYLVDSERSLTPFVRCFVLLPEHGG